MGVIIFILAVVVLYVLIEGAGRRVDRARGKKPKKRSRKEKIEDCINWAKKFEIQLNSEQAEAVCFDGDENLLVTARAGSGKTRVLATRALWLVDQCGVDPSEILLLAFNKNAVEEMEERLTVNLGQKIPYVMTFHALAHAIVKPDEKLLYDNSQDEHFELTEEVVNIVKRGSFSKVVEGLAKKTGIAESVSLLEIAAFKDGWYQLATGKLDLDMEPIYEDDKEESSEGMNKIVIESKYKTLDGKNMKSFGEQCIANVLVENDISYEYEKLVDWNGGGYRPDFIISTGDDSGVVIEYFGLNSIDYERERVRKRNFWSQKENWELIELEPRDVRGSREESFFSAFLLDKLSRLGVTHRPLSVEEVVKRIPITVRKNDLLDAYTSFIIRCRILGLGYDELLTKDSKYTPADSEEAEFLTVIKKIYLAYLEEVIGEGHEDFAGLLWRASEKISNGESGFNRKSGRQIGDIKNIRHVLIDEFQDFSEPFNALIKRSREINKSFKTFAVGDDWQAINGFAGSDLKFFKVFKFYFHASKELVLKNNYRSSKRIVEVSNAFIKDSEPSDANPLLGIANTDEMGEAVIWDLKEFELSPNEEIEHEDDKLKAALLRIIKNHFDEGRDVLLLSRTNSVRSYSQLYKYTEALLSYFPPGQKNTLSISTTHRYKGLEAPAVIIVDAERYPLVHPNWKFQRIFGDSRSEIGEEERKLFYVALTRAEIALDVITKDLEEDSVFLNGIKKKFKWGRWEDLPLFEYGPSDRLIVKVSNAYDVREILKTRNFRFDNLGKYWTKTAPKSELEDFSRLERQDWFQPPVKVEVFSENGDLVWQKEAIENQFQNLSSTHMEKKKVAYSRKPSKKKKSLSNTDEYTSVSKGHRPRGRLTPMAEGKFSECNSCGRPLTFDGACSNPSCN